MAEDEFDAIMRNKQALLNQLNLDDDDPLKKIMANHDLIVKKHQN